jgi:hypothetical protein
MRTVAGEGEELKERVRSESLRVRSSSLRVRSSRRG